jgi:hypothetical protein
MALSAFAAGGGKDQFFNGAFRADDVKLNWTGGGAKEGALVQSAQWQCQRTVNFLYEIGSTAVYYVGNRRQGNATFTRVVAGSQTFKTMVKTFGNLCKPENLTIDATQAACKNGATTGGGVKYTLVSATLTQVGGNVTANDIVINEQLGFMFVDLYYV